MRNEERERLAMANEVERDLNTSTLQRVGPADTASPANGTPKKVAAAITITDAPTKIKKLIAMTAASSPTANLPRR